MEVHSRLAQVMVDHQLIDEHQAQAAEGRVRSWGGTFVESLVELNFVRGDEAALFLSKYTNNPFVDFETLDVPREILRAVSEELCERYCLIPLDVEISKRMMTVAMSDPMNLSAVDEIRFRTNMRVKLVVASVDRITRAIKKYYNGGSQGEVEEGTGASPSGFGSFDAGDTMSDNGFIDISEIGDPHDQSGEVKELKEKVAKLEHLLSQHIAVLKGLTNILLEKKIFTREEFLEIAKKRADSSSGG